MRKSIKVYFSQKQFDIVVALLEMKMEEAYEAGKVDTVAAVDDVLTVLDAAEQLVDEE